MQTTPPSSRVTASADAEPSSSASDGPASEGAPLDEPPSARCPPDDAAPLDDELLEPPSLLLVLLRVPPQEAASVAASTRTGAIPTCTVGSMADETQKRQGR